MDVESDIGDNKPLEGSDINDECVFHSPNGFLWGFAALITQVTVVYVVVRLRSLYKSEWLNLSMSASEESIWTAKICHLEKKLDEMTYSFIGPMDEGATSKSLDNDVEVGSCDRNYFCREEICSICLDEYNENDSIIPIEKCQHKFHRQCLEFWIVQKRMETCPYCRDTLTFTKEAEAIAQREMKEEVYKLDITMERIFKYGKFVLVVAALESLLIYNLYLKMSVCV